MMRSRAITSTGRTCRILTVAAAIVTLSGCSASESGGELGSSPQKPENAPAAAIPRPNSGSSGPVVHLPGNPAATAASMTGPTVEELYRQGKIEVVR